MAYFAGSNGDDYLVGTDHADRFAPLRGYDLVSGGDGLDSLVLDYSSAGFTSYSYAYVHSVGSSLNGFVQSGDGQNWVSFDGVERLEFKLDNGDGNFWLEGSALGLGATMDVDAGMGVDTLEADFSTLGPTAFEIAVNGKVKVNGSTFTNFENYFLRFGSGSDTVRLGAGEDVVLAGAGNDFVDVGDGDDLVIAGDGNDHLIGGNGDDTLYGEAGYNLLIGGTGDDSLVSQGSDIVDGGEGDDYWQGDYQASSDNLTFTINGSSGGVSNGTTIFSVEAVTIFSGSGDDRFIISNVTPAPEVGNSVFIFGGEGVDSLELNLADGATGSDYIVTYDEGSSFSGVSNGVSFSGLEHVSVTGDPSDVARLTSFFSSDVHLTVQPDGTLRSNIGVTLSNYGAFDIQLFDGNDTVELGSGNDVIYSGAGNDIVDVGGGDDFVSAGEGDDQVLGGDGNDAVSAGDGDDHVIGGEGNDALYGEAGSNILIGGSGNDSLVSQGSDIVDGGEGIDYWQGDYQASSDNLTFTYNGLSGSVSNGTIVSSVETATILSGSGNDQFLLSGVARTPEGGASVIVYGGEGVDSLDLNLANGTVGTDNIAIHEEGSSFSGSTTSGASYSGFEIANFTGDAGDTARLFLGLFSSDIQLTVQPDGTMSSNIGVTLSNYGAFRIDLGSGNDTVLGGARRDVIQGAGGDDVINGGGGGDSVFGGEGADMFDFDKLADFGIGSVDVINDFTSADGDKIDLQDVVAGDFSFVGNENFSASGAAEIRLQNATGGNTLVQGDLDGDGVTDFTFIVLGTQSLGSSDFLF